MLQGDFFNLPPLIQQKKIQKGPMRQPEALLDEGFHGTAALVGSIAFLYFATKQWGSVKRITLFVGFTEPSKLSAVPFK